MTKESIRCLFCQTLNDVEDSLHDANSGHTSEEANDSSCKSASHNSSNQSINSSSKKKREMTKPQACQNCGMLLSLKNPEGSLARRKRWLPFFWFVVIFCLVMMIYLPR